MKDITVATRYADALYEEAKSSNVIEAVAGDLSQLREILRTDKDFSVFINTPALPVTDKLAVIDKIVVSGKLNHLTHGLLVVLANKHRLDILDATIDAVMQRIRIDKSEIEVRVDYAVPVTDAVRSALIEQLKKVTKQKVILKENIDESLLGGMKVFIASQLYDLSVRGKLDALKTKINK